MFFKNLITLTLICTAVAINVNQSAYARYSTLNEMSGSWDDVAGFVTFGQCSGAPTTVGLYTCSPAQLPYVKEQRFEAGGFVSATESVLKIADTIRAKNITTEDVSKLFSSYNYSEFLVSSKVNYVRRNFIIGLRPYRLQGQFQVHNPNLPLVSLSYREDLIGFVGLGYAVDLSKIKLSAGFITSVLHRKETIAEATLVEIASKAPAEILNSQDLRGHFTDFGLNSEFYDFISTSFTLKDVGQYWKGKDLSRKYLFVISDRTSRYQGTFSFIPKLWVGRLQVGGSMLGFFDRSNEWGDQWLGTVSYYVGPLRVMSSFRTDLFRTGLELSFNTFQVSVAQEWLNKLETGRNIQPRFTVGVTAGL